MPTISPVIVKMPAEIIPVSMDWAELLPSTEVVDANLSTIVITDPDDVDVSSAMLVSRSVTGYKVAGIIQAGTSGLDYTVTITIKTTNFKFISLMTLKVRPTQV